MIISHNWAINRPLARRSGIEVLGNFWVFGFWVVDREFRVKRVMLIMQLIVRVVAVRNVRLIRGCEVWDFRRKSFRGKVFRVRVRV